VLAVVVMGGMFASAVAGAGAGGAYLPFVVFQWTGSANLESVSTANISGKGLVVVDERSEFVMWSQSCTVKMPPPPWTGFGAALCKPQDTLVLGKVEDHDPLDSSRDCEGYASASPGYAFGPIGGIELKLSPHRDGVLFRPAATAPIFQGVKFRVSGNALNGSCDGFSFWSNGGYKALDAEPSKETQDRIYVGYAFPKTWSNQTDGRGISEVEHFSGYLASTESSVPPSPPPAPPKTNGEALFQVVSNAINNLLGFLGNNPTDPVPPIKLEFPDWGDLQVLAATPDPTTVLTIHQRLQAGANNLQVNLTPQGRTYLLTSPDPHLNLTLTFTPTYGAATTYTTTITPFLPPSITSVQFSGSPSNPTIAVRGRALTPLPTANPTGSPAGHDGCPTESGTTGSDYGSWFGLIDTTGNWSAGNSDPSANFTSCIGIVPTKVTPGEVDFRLGSFYTSLYPKFKLNPGDQVEVVVNGTPLNVHVAYGAPVTK
jgi:hypothetical protein